MTRCDALVGCKCLCISYTAFSTVETSNTGIPYYGGIGIISIPPPFFPDIGILPIPITYYGISGTIRFRYPSPMNHTRFMLNHYVVSSASREVFHSLRLLAHLLRERAYILRWCSSDAQQATYSRPSALFSKPLSLPESYFTQKLQICVRFVFRAIVCIFQIFSWFVSQRRST